MNYWEQRTKQLNKALENDEERLKRRLVNYYRREAKRLDKEIASFYQRYGENNIIEYRKLLQQMSSDDIQLLYEDMDEFARKYPQYSHLMPTRANIYKLTRLEGLQQSVYMAQLRLGAITDIELTAHLEKQAKRYGRAADTANGKVFNMVNEQTVKGFVNTEWSNGKNFSQRIWDNAQKLSDTLNTELAQGFARGETYEKLTKQITDKFETVSRNNAYRLIYTEGTYVMNESSIQGFSEDFEQYEYSIVEDGHACPICTALDGKVFNIRDRVPGVNFPPMHPWCRCSFKIHVDDWSEWLKSQSNKTRAQKVLNNLSDDDIVENRNVLKLNVQLFAKKSSDFKTVVLPPKEYGKVMHTLATDISKEQLNKKTFYKSIGDYIYYVENNGFGNFRIIGKSKIK
nr:MAG TPA: minor capsid protein [Caudoviricetes sp.]